MIKLIPIPRIFKLDYLENGASHEKVLFLHFDLFLHTE